MSSIEQTVECYHGEINAENRGTEFEVTVIMYGSIQENDELYRKFNKHKKEWSKVLYYKSKGGISKWKREM